MYYYICIAAAALSTATSSSTTCDDINNCRTVSSIVYNCLSTMLLCTWVALHLNVPIDPWEADWKILMTRISWMLLALVAPEVVLFRAFRQWVGGCGQMELKLKADPTCDWTETHAMLARMGGLQLVSKDGSKHLKYNLSNVPSDVDMPRKEEVQDRGKSDNIAKTIAIIQTLWFAIQAAHRVSQGLVVTELELTTLGHVLLNVFTYWCWWNKPLGVRFPIDVYPKSPENQPERPSSAGGDENNDQHDDPESHKKVTQPRLAMRVKIGAYLYRHGADGVADMAWDRVPFLVLVCFFVGFSILGSMFGAVHCLAWNSTFPSEIEHIMWRVSALVVTAIPILTIVVSAVVDHVEGVLQAFLGYGLLLVMPFFYGVARICLFVLALMALRHLPYTAYEMPSWTSFIPHIG
ncbi:hypothetical protein JOM56_004437 [Amanita muscaria]